MGFYFRRSVSAGPFRFNFSKSGMGISVGVKGLRLGAGPRGHYVNAGANGFYYRATVGNKTKSRSAPNMQPDVPRETRARFDQSGIRYVEIDSGNVDGMRDSNADAIIADISAKSAKFRYSTMLFWLSSAITVFAWAALHQQMLPFTPIVLVAYFIGKWLDSFLRVAVLMYDLDDYAKAEFKMIADTFVQLSKSEKIWHIPIAGKIETVKQWKQNAGANAVVQRKDIRLNFGLPDVLRCNFNVPRIPVGNQAFYFFPDFMLVTDGRKVGGVDYSNLKIKVEHTHFIEDGRVPRDSNVVGKRWLHPNKTGGPDKRFSKNKQLPICLYEDVLFQSDSGVKELLTFSKVGLFEQFRNALGIN